MNDWEHGLEISHWFPSEQFPNQHIALGATRVPLSNASTTDAADEQLNILEDDVIGVFDVNLPRPGVIEQHTVKYADALRMGAASFRQLVVGKIILVCSLRSDNDDVHVLGDGTQVQGAAIVAAGLDQIWTGKGTRILDAFSDWEFQIAAGVLGAIVGTKFQGRWRRRWLVLAALLIALLGASVVFLVRGIDWSPVPAMLGVILASEAAVALLRLLIGRSETLVEEAS
jgi:CHASE2 domain-containing sensor protein